MENKTENINKRKYSKPAVEVVKIDNEISLVMMTPPPDPEHMGINQDGDFNPFKITNI